MYDKFGSVLRTETTINQPKDFKVYRRKENDKDGPKEWRCLRKGVADIRRRAQVSQAANERYLQALAHVDQPSPLGDMTKAICRPTRWKGKRVRRSTRSRRTTLPFWKRSPAATSLSTDFAIVTFGSCSIVHARQRPRRYAGNRPWSRASFAYCELTTSSKRFPRLIAIS